MVDQMLIRCSDKRRTDRAQDLPEDLLFRALTFSLLSLEELMPINLAALSDISGLPPGGGESIPKSSTSTDCRLEIGLEGERPLRRVDLVLMGGAPPEMKAERPMALLLCRECLASVRFSPSEAEDLDRKSVV